MRQKIFVENDKDRNEMQYPVDAVVVVYIFGFSAECIAEWRFFMIPQ